MRYRLGVTAPGAEIPRLGDGQDDQQPGEIDRAHVVEQVRLFSTERSGQDDDGEDCCDSGAVVDVADSDSYEKCCPGGEAPDKFGHCSVLSGLWSVDTASPSETGGAPVDSAR